MKRGSREFRRFTWSGSPGRARMSGPESTECYPNFRRRTARTAHTNATRKFYDLQGRRGRGGGTLEKRRKAGGGLGPPRELLLALVGEVRKDRNDALAFVID
jgi:hypothetical protein